MRTGEYPDDWDDRRKQVLERDRYECQECGATNRTLHVHHITPISEGGGHRLSNLEALCESCHAEEHPTLVTLSDSITNNKRLRMRYYSPSSGSNTRDFDPYAIDMHNGMQFVVGYDSRHEEIRYFRPKRIQWVEETSDYFQPPSDFNADEFLAANVDYGKSKCFIATAAYGTPHAQEIDLLRSFRDDVLLQSIFGTLFVRVYYRLSPPIAEWISRKDWRQKLVRKTVIDPLLRLVSLIFSRCSYRSRGRRRNQ